MTGSYAKGYVETPLIRSGYLSDRCRRNVYLKLENTQPSGSFKSRGISELIRRALVESSGARVHVYSSSGGNAGLAAATAAAFYGVPCTVVVPESTKQAMRERITKAGASLVVHGAHWAMADEHMRGMMALAAGDEVAVYAHPFDDPVIWEGHSSLVEELPFKPDAIVVSCGGGGLYNGVKLGLANRGWDSKVLVVETKGAATLNKTLEAGKIIRLDKIDTIATSLGSVYVTDKTLEYALDTKGGITDSVVIEDSDAMNAVIQFASDHKMLVEPACGASLALGYSESLHPYLEGLDSIVIVVCGGSSISIEDIVRFG
ncbi:L-threo-3-hydroxyaspartate ammonia-lyase [Trichomonascus vanleenenianus]|uniref:L-threo-3-hydroxyaspartate ammonia-lyase n=1 Tax=Trichomonascus vanleenenianus TaxID=2268995 RepID=UPI003ECA1DC9